MLRDNKMFCSMDKAFAIVQLLHEKDNVVETMKITGNA